MGTTKTEGGQGCKISLKGCSTSVVLATGPNDEEEEEGKPYFIYPQNKNHVVYGQENEVAKSQGRIQQTMTTETLDKKKIWNVQCKYDDALRRTELAGH